MRGKQTLKRRASKLRRSDALMVSAYNARNQPDGLLVQRGCSSKGAHRCMQNSAVSMSALK